MTNSNSQQFDVVVIGAGPAGSSAAHTLASRGFRVAIVDKKDFPRDKLCGGLLSLRSTKIYQQIFTKPWDKIIQTRSKGLRIYDGNKLLNQVDNYKTFAFTNRADFDAFLLEQAIAVGSQAYLGKAVKRIDLTASQVELKDGTVLQADCIIGADGVNSLVAHQLFGSAFDKDQTAFGLEIEFPRNETDIIIDKPEIFFNQVNWGYAWVFPKRKTYTVGIGGLYGQNTNLKQNFSEFVEQRFSQPLEHKIKGHFIPFGQYKKSPGRNNILLCGDAAGLVEPITGEGIAFAMESGQYAGLACIKALKNKSPQLAYRYYYPLFRKVSSDIRTANKLKQFVFRKNLNGLFMSLLPKHPGAMKLHVDLMSADISYPIYARRLFTKTAKALLSRTFSFTNKTTS